MIKEELEKEAEKNILNLKNNSIKVSGKPFQINNGDYIQGYLDGAEPREKRIAELEAQIEKMKCCGNCKYRELIKEHGQWKERLNCKGNGCVLHSKWVMRNF